MSAFVGDDLACRRGFGEIVFRAVDFSLLPGAALVVTGRNGAGKSSMLRLLAGLLKPAAGRLTWAGKPLSEDPEAHRARLLYIGHENAVKPGLTIAENLQFWAGLRGKNEADTSAALAQWSLPTGDLPAAFLSAGQRRRLALSRLSMINAELWLLDEPTASLDAEGQACLASAIAHHRAGGGRLVATTHAALDIEDAAELSLDDPAHRAEVLAGEDLIA